MRTMPKAIDADKSLGTPACELPAVSPEAWMSGVRALVGRALTEGELTRCERMAKHNWSIRVAAEDILGRDLTYEEVEARRNW